MSSKMLQSSLSKTHIGGYGKTNIEFYSDMHPLQKTIITIHYHFTRMYIYMQEHVNTDIYVSLKYFICKVCIKLKKVPLQIIHPLSTKYFLCPPEKELIFLQTWYVIDCRTFLNVLREIHDYKGMWHVGIYVCVNNPLLASLYFWSQLVPLQGIRILYRAQKIVHRFKCEEILYKHRIVTCRLIKSFFEKKKE